MLINLESESPFSKLIKSRKLGVGNYAITKIVVKVSENATNTSKLKTQNSKLKLKLKLKTQTQTQNSNSKLKTQNAKRKTQNAKLKTQSYELHSLKSEDYRFIPDENTLNTLREYQQINLCLFPCLSFLIIPPQDDYGSSLCHCHQPHPPHSHDGYNRWFPRFFPLHTHGGQLPHFYRPRCL